MLANKILKVTKFLLKPNVRCSSKCIQKNTTEQSLIRQTLDKYHKPTFNEWHQLRKKLMLSTVDQSSINIDEIILRNCFPDQLDAGKSYLNYLKESGDDPKSSTLIMLLELYYRANKSGTELTSNDQVDIVEICENLRKKYPAFDSKSGEGIIYGLVLTADWRKSLEIFDSIKISSKPSSSAYSALIQRALQEQDEHLAWNLLNDMVEDCDEIQNEVFISYIGCCERKPSTFTENIDKLLMFIGDNRIVVSDKVVNEIQRTFHKFSYNCSTSTVSKQGLCQSCRKRLRDIDITDDEFNKLSNHFFDKIFVEENVKSTPEELRSFIAFVDQTGPYDCVIDGLNVGHFNHTTKPIEQSRSLAGVVRHFVNQKKSVLIIGRKHMVRWPKENMDYIRKNAHLFLAENSSQDDLFFMYSTLKSGPNTDFVTNDVMRDHTFALDKTLKTVYRRWQEQHRYKVKAISDYGRITFEEPVKFDMNAQQVDGCWHIPYENGVSCSLKENYWRKNWLCVTKQRS